MTSEQAPSSEARRRRGRKPYPTLTFERALELPKAISEYAIDGRIRRLTLLDQMGRSAGSSNSRALITGSGRYGLSAGGYQAEHLELTTTGEAVVNGDLAHNASTIRQVFHQAITITDPFSSVYDRLKNERIPASQVLQDLLAQEGIDEADCEEAAAIFIENIRYIGLIKEQMGNEYIIPLEQLLEELPASAQESAEEPLTEIVQELEVGESAEPVDASTTSTPPVVGNPALHIDIQIHIDSSASAEQIDRIFASMARHLYRREG